MAENNMQNVKFTGAVYGDDLKKLISNSKFVIIPSECYDNSPLVVYEAYCMGKPVIGSIMGGIPELVRDGESGLLYEAFAVDELAAALARLIETPQLLDRMAAQAPPIKPIAEDARWWEAIYGERRGRRRPEAGAGIG